LKSFSYFSRFKEDETAMRFLNDPEAQDGFKNTKLLSSIAASNYKAIFMLEAMDQVLLPSIIF